MEVLHINQSHLVDDMFVGKLVATVGRDEQVGVVVCREEVLRQRDREARLPVFAPGGRVIESDIKGALANMYKDSLVIKDHIAARLVR